MASFDTRSWNHGVLGSSERGGRDDAGERSMRVLATSPTCIFAAALFILGTDAAAIRFDDGSVPTIDAENRYPFDEVDILLSHVDRLQIWGRWAHLSPPMGVGLLRLVQLKNRKGKFARRCATGFLHQRLECSPRACENHIGPGLNTGGWSTAPPRHSMQFSWYASSELLRRLDRFLGEGSRFDLRPGRVT